MLNACCNNIHSVAGTGFNFVYAPSELTCLNLHAGYSTPSVLDRIFLDPKIQKSRIQNHDNNIDNTVFVTVETCLLTFVPMSIFFNFPRPATCEYASWPLDRHALGGALLV